MLNRSTHLHLWTYEEKLYLSQSEMRATWIKTKLYMAEDKAKHSVWTTICVPAPGMVGMTECGNVCLIWSSDR